MHLVGARFATMEAATAALRDIRGTLPVEAADVELRPLGTTRYDAPISDVVVAGRFEAWDVERAVGILEGHGGGILVHREEPRRPGRPGWPRATATPGVTAPGGIERTAKQRLVRTGPAARAGASPARKLLRRPATHLRVRAARDRNIRH